MTVSNQLARVTYTGDGVNSVWNITFVLLSAADLEVSIFVPSTGITTVLAPSDYTVDLGALQVTRAVPLGHKITLRRNMALVQQTALGNQQRFYGEVVEQSLDRLVLMIQQINSVAVIDSAEVINNAALVTALLQTVQTAAEAAATAAEASAVTAALEAAAAAVSEIAAQNHAAAASSSATAANNALLNIGVALLQDLGAFSVNADGELIATYAGNVIQALEINAGGNLLVTYEV